MKQINFTVDDRVYAALSSRAREHGYQATGYAKMLFEAANDAILILEAQDA